MTVEVRKAGWPDVLAIEPYIVTDQWQRLTALGVPVEVTLGRMLAAAEDTIYATADGHPLCLGAVQASGGFLCQAGAIWMVVTDELRRHPKRFMRESKNWIEELKTRYVSLHDFCQVGDARNIRWMKWLGFELHDPMPSPLDGTMVYPVEWRRWA